jgi:hypothetical protein
MQVLSEIADTAVGRVGYVLAEFRSAARFRDDRSPVMHRRVSGDDTDTLEMLALPQLMTVTEAFVTDRLSTCAAAHKPNGYRLADVFWDRANQWADGTWGRRWEAWNEWFGIKFSDYVNRRAFDGFVEARNTISHGCGRLTLRQARDGKVKGTIMAAGIRMQGNRIQLVPRDIDQCGRACAELIVWLDERAAYAEAAARSA